MFVCGCFAYNGMVAGWYHGSGKGGKKTLDILGVSRVPVSISLTEYLALGSPLVNKEVEPGDVCHFNSESMVLCCCVSECHSHFGCM